MASASGNWPQCISTRTSSDQAFDKIATILKAVPAEGISENLVQMISSLLIPCAASSQTQKALELLQASPVRIAFESLEAGLPITSGETPKAAREIYELGLDVAKRIRAERFETRRSKKMRTKKVFEIFGILTSCCMLMVPALQYSQVIADPMPPTGVILPGQAPEPLKLLLQVGIDKYQKPVPPLDGCVNDTVILKKVLMEKYGFKTDGIKFLLDEKATREAILITFRTHLIERARKNFEAHHQDRSATMVVFQYSGHGSQVPDKNGDEPDHKDETLVPYDSRELVEGVESEYDIVDDEIDELFTELKQYSNNIVFIFDSCHSGTGTRDGAVTRLKAREYLPKDIWAVKSRAGKARETKPAQSRDNSEAASNTATKLPRDRSSYIAIAGCAAVERAYEYEGMKPDPNAGNKVLKTHNGQMTYILVQELERASPDLTYGELMNRVIVGVLKQVPYQHPELEGDVGRVVFGGAASAREPGIAVTQVDGKMITIAAGAAQGVKKDTAVAIYDRKAERLSGETNKLANAVIQSVEAFSSLAEVVSENPKKIEIGAKAKLVAPNLGTGKIKVANGLNIADPTLSTNGKLTLASVARAASLGDFVKQVETSDRVKDLIEIVNSTPKSREVNGEAQPTPDITVKMAEFRKAFLNNSELALDSTGDKDPVCYLSTGDGSPLFGFYLRPDDPNGASKIATVLESFAWQQNLLALSNDAVPDSIRNKLKITFIQIEGTPTSGGGFKVSKTTPLPEQLSYTLNEGGYFQFKIENTANQDLYITLFDISNDGSISILAKERMPAWTGSFSTSVFQSVKPVGHEVFKIIATTSDTNFDFLERKSVSNFTPRDLKRRGAPLTPIEQFMARAAGLTPRGTIVAGNPGAFDSWTTAEARLLIQSPSK